MNVVIIESPGKKKSIEKYTGAIVIPTFGHIKDLPLKELGVNLSSFEGTFLPKDKRQEDHIKYIVNTCKGKDVCIATDADREGEAIAAIVYQEIEKVCNSCTRATFGEITKDVVISSISSAIPFSEFDWNAYYSFLGRRIGDRIVGYLLSGIVHHKSGWSAGDKKDFMSVGRVQTVAVKLIVARKEEILLFVPIPYIDIEAKCKKEEKSFVVKHLNNGFKDLLLANNTFDKIKDIKEGVVTKVETKPSKTNPKPPYITSSIQAHSSTALNLSGKQTMFLLQKLYEGFGNGGVITYHRTDSSSISSAYSSVIGEYLQATYPGEYSGPRAYKSKQSQAEAHECIRPVVPPIEFDSTCSQIEVELEKVKAGLGKKGVSLYKMICQRTLASQLDSAEYDRTILELNILDETLKGTGSVLTKSGFLVLKQEEEEGDEAEDGSLLPAVSVGDLIEIESVKKESKETNPPSEYTEPSLIKKLEKEGVGRPSTYATILDTLFSKNYADKVKGKKTITPTKKAFSLISTMDKEYPFLVDLKFTALLETDLDLVASGELPWQEAMAKLYLQMGSPTPQQRAPTENMIKLALKLSETAEEAFDQEKSEDFAYVSSYLSKNINKTPSEAQLNFAYSIESRVGVKLPEVAKSDYSILNKWITTNKDKPSLNLSEKQLALVEKYAPDDIKELIGSENKADKVKIGTWLKSFFNKKKKK